MFRRANLRLWLVRLITWDGLLPAFVWSFPGLIRLLFPNNRAAIELTAVTLPIMAFFIRYRVGKRYIVANNCGTVMRDIQLGVFFMGIFVLILIDAVVMLLRIMPKGAAFETTEEWIVWGILLGIYLISMAFAMYPGPLATPT